MVDRKILNPPFQKYEPVRDPYPTVWLPPTEWQQPSEKLPAFACSAECYLQKLIELGHQHIWNYGRMAHLHLNLLEILTEGESSYIDLGELEIMVEGESS